MLKKTLLTTLGVLFLFCLINFQAITYGISQGIGQLKVVNEAKPFDHFFKSPSFPDSLKEKLQLVEEIKRYCEDSLNLKVGDNYTELFDQKGKPGMWVVTAAQPFLLESYQWSFPFLGSFSYKGFFDQEKAIILATELKNKGYDTDIGEVNAWSTLGWFKDPVMSSMLEKTEGLLARVLIHEITHYNIFVKNDITYNENLASFIGDIGALKFLKDKYGKESHEFNTLQNYLDDIKIFTQFMVRKSTELNEFYLKTGIETQPNKFELKQEKIKSIMYDLQKEEFKGTYLLQAIIEESHKINNTFFTDFLTYKEQNGDMELDFTNNFNRKVILYIQAQKEKHGI